MHPAWEILMWASSTKSKVRKCGLVVPHSLPGFLDPRRALRHFFLCHCASRDLQELCPVLGKIETKHAKSTCDCWLRKRSLKPGV